MMEMKKIFITSIPFLPIIFMVPEVTFSTGKKTTMEISTVINSLTTKAEKK